jgi:5-methylcytosine-specific restriction endonuclease McrA
MGAVYVTAVLRRLVYERADGRCEYCLIPESAVLVSHEIDHIIAQKHGGVTQADNLALSCTLCNRHKGSDLVSLASSTNELVRLYHPRHDNWKDHFSLTEARIVPLTLIGQATTRLLQFNRPDRIKERALLIAAGFISLLP